MMSQLPLWVALPVAILLVISGLLTVTGSLGLLRLSSFFARTHAPTLGNTLGTFCILVASILTSSFLEQRVIVHQILITIFLVITSPVTAMLLMRAGIKRHARAIQREQVTKGSLAGPSEGSEGQEGKSMPSDKDR